MENRSINSSINNGLHNGSDQGRYSENIHPNNPTGQSLLRFRFAQPSDQEIIKALCTEWFPVRYADTWYHDVAHRPDLFLSIVAEIIRVDSNILQSQFGQPYFHHDGEGNVDGLLVAEIRQLHQCVPEDSLPLEEYYNYCACGRSSLNENSLICYILSLGVRKELRRQNIATALIDQLERSLPPSCCLLYLHVLDTNFSARRFYTKQYFVQLAHLSDYYHIDGCSRNGYCYARIRLSQSTVPINRLAIDSQNKSHVELNKEDHTRSTMTIGSLELLSNGMGNTNYDQSMISTAKQGNSTLSTITSQEKSFEYRKSLDSFSQLQADFVNDVSNAEPRQQEESTFNFNIFLSYPFYFMRRFTNWICDLTSRLNL